jgi:hypothetical protein
MALLSLNQRRIYQSDALAAIAKARKLQPETPLPSQTSISHQFLQPGFKNQPCLSFLPCFATTPNYFQNSRPVLPRIRNLLKGGQRAPRFA